MKKKVVVLLAGILFILIVIMLLCFSPKQPFKKLKAVDIETATVLLNPPGETVEIIDKDKLVDLLSDVVIYNRDDSYSDYLGQSTIFNIALADGTNIEILAYNPFIVINGKGYKTKYEPCEELNAYANKILSGNNELTIKEQSFVGKVIEETTTYMIVEPAEDEYERTLTQRMMVKYDTDHVDYLYGTGRLVVIYYDADNMIKGGAMPIIEFAEISTEGFREWELKVTPTKMESHKILAVPKAAPHDSDSASHWYKQYNLYYYDLDEVMVSVDGSEYPLAHAIKLGKISMSAILAKANRDVADGVIEEISYDDGGSFVFKYPDYTIVKYHTLDGNDDMYIGTPDIDIHVKDK